jgi:hypothetical protein
LWIDGRPVQTLESALSADTFFHHVTLPLMGLGFLGMAFLVGKGLRRKPANPELQRTGCARR